MSYELVRTLSLFIYGPYSNFLLDYFDYILIFYLLVIGVLIKSNFKYIRTSFSSINKKIWVTLILILLFGLYLRLMTFQIEDSEFIFESGYTWQRYQVYKTINGERLQLEHNHPFGYKVILMLWQFVFGFNSISAIFLNIILSVTTGFLIFLLAYIFFNNQKTALFSSFIFIILPHPLFFSTTSLSITASVLFIVLSLLSFFISIRFKKISLFILTIAIVAYMVHIRIDSSLYILVFIIATLLFFKKKLVWLKKNLKYCIILLLICLILFLPILPWYYNFIDFTNEDSWSVDVPSQQWSFENFNRSLRMYSLYLTRWNYYPVNPEFTPPKLQGIFQYSQFFILLALLIIPLLSHSKDIKKYIFLLSFFPVFYLGYGAKGDFENHMIRWCLSLSIPLALLLGNSIVYVGKWLSKIIFNKSILNVILIFIVIILFWNPVKLAVPERKEYPNGVIMIKEECEKFGDEPYLYFYGPDLIIRLLCKSKYSDIGNIDYTSLKESINRDLMLNKELYIFYQKKSLTPDKPKTYNSTLEMYLPYLERDFNLTTISDNDLFLTYKINSEKTD